MPHYKLHYFNLRGRAESTRILLSLVAADWEDIRVNDWKIMKGSGIAPYGQLPILEVDATVLGQSTAILRYLAKEHGVLPETNLQTAIADGIVDQIQDCLSKFANAWQEKDPDKKKEKSKDLLENIVPQSMKYFEKILKENCQGKTFFFGDKITYADIHFFDFTNSMLGGGKLEVPDILTKFPHLTKLYNAVMNEPSIHEYLKKRPQTDH